MVGDVTCSPCQGEGRRFEPGVPLQSKAPVSENISEPGPLCSWNSASAWNKDGTFAAPPVALNKIALVVESVRGHSRCAECLLPATSRPRNRAM